MEEKTRWQKDELCQRPWVSYKFGESSECRLSLLIHTFVTYR